MRNLQQNRAFFQEWKKSKSKLEEGESAEDLFISLDNIKRKSFSIRVMLQQTIQHHPELKNYIFEHLEKFSLSLDEKQQFFQPSTPGSSNPSSASSSARSSKSNSRANSRNITPETSRPPSRGQTPSQPPASISRNPSIQNIMLPMISARSNSAISRSNSAASSPLSSALSSAQSSRSSSRPTSARTRS